MALKFSVLTLFPEMFDMLKTSIIGRAAEKGLIDVSCVNIRDFTKNKHRRVDDYPYGAGGGMVMQAQPIYDAYRSVAGDDRPLVIYMSPQGKVLNQKLARDLSREEHIILLCGHYEGVDERVLEEIVDMEVSIGDYVLTGGELPAMVLIDCVSRMREGVLDSKETFETESHYDGLLEYPQYTRPPEFMGRTVPEVLMGGNHKDIERWRREKKLERTRSKRPDLLKKALLTKDDEEYLKHKESEI